MRDCLKFVVLSEWCFQFELLNWQRVDLASRAACLSIMHSDCLAHISAVRRRVIMRPVCFL